MRQTHAAGEKLFVDFAGDTVPVFDGLTGEVRAAKIFVAAFASGLDKRFLQRPRRGARLGVSLSQFPFDLSLRTSLGRCSLLERQPRWWGAFLGSTPRLGTHA
jgi:hypothetical protein